jgi:hypothetical protein
MSDAMNVLDILFILQTETRRRLGNLESSVRQSDEHKEFGRRLVRTYQFPMSLSLSLHKTHAGMGKNVKEHDLSLVDKIQAELSVKSDPVIDNDFLSFINATCTTTRLNNIKSIQW